MGAGLGVLAAGGVEPWWPMGYAHAEWAESRLDESFGSAMHDTMPSAAMSHRLTCSTLSGVLGGRNLLQPLENPKHIQTAMQDCCSVTRGYFTYVYLVYIFTRKYYLRKPYEQLRVGVILKN